MADESLKIGLNLLGLPTLRQGGAGLLAGLEAQELSGRRGIALRVLAGTEVAGELSEAGIPATAVQRAPRSPAQPVRRLLELRGPMHHEAEAAPPQAFVDCDVVHYPLSFMAAPEYGGATVVTCVDLQHLHFPRFFSRRDRLLRALRWHPSVRRATRVAVYSRFVRDSVEERLGVPRDRIDVVGACCSERFFEFRDEVRPDREFLLYPASPLPAKNHRRLLDAFGRLRGSHPDLRLVLVGPATHDWAPVKRRIELLGLTGQVEIRGHVSLGELIDLYRAARAMVFPSLFEGFGIPVLEAMAAGCPVAAADATSIPEVCGEAAVLFDPEDIDSIAEGIGRVLDMPEGERNALVALGRERAARFSAAAMVDRQLGSFERAVDTIPAA